jgi:ADP-ribose pyrophosphatase YjhB (NUDIX family)
MEANAASVALIRGGEVLLIQRAFEPLKGLWTLPGGRREPGETIADTAAREVVEEVAIRVENLQAVLQMAVTEEFRLQVFATRDFSGTITPSPEVADWKWAGLDALPQLSTTPDLERVLRRAFGIAGAPQNH